MEFLHCEKFNVFFVDDRHEFVYQSSAISDFFVHFIVFAVDFEIYGDVAGVGGKHVYQFVFILFGLFVENNAEVFFFRFFLRDGVFRIRAYADGDVRRDGDLVVVADL